MRTQPTNWQSLAKSLVYELATQEAERRFLCMENPASQKPAPYNYVPPTDPLTFDVLRIEIARELLCDLSARFRKDREIYKMIALACLKTLNKRDAAQFGTISGNNDDGLTWRVQKIVKQNVRRLSETTLKYQQHAYDRGEVQAREFAFYRDERDPNQYDGFRYDDD